jgi:hypothetical protein
MAKRKKRPLLVTDREGKRIFVPLSHSAIHPLVALCDALTFVYFGKKGGPYLDVQTALDWHEKELRDSCGRSGSREAVDAFRKILDSFKAGEIDWD